MKRLVLLRHGESVWNLANRFTGWTDVDLSDNGKAEAQKAGKLLKKYEFSFDRAYSSVLKRAIRTLWIVLDELDEMWLPTEHNWRLNERHYGALQGLNKAETAVQYGEEQVHLWRRSYDIPPPLLEPSDERHPKNDPRYADIPAGQLPGGESLKDTLHRLFHLSKTEDGGWDLECRVYPGRHARKRMVEKRRRPRIRRPRDGNLFRCQCYPGGLGQIQHVFLLASEKGHRPLQE